MIKDRTGATPVPSCSCRSVLKRARGRVDLIEMKEWSGSDEDLGASGTSPKSRTISRTKAEEYRGKLIETAVEMDDAAMEAYLEGERAGQ
jgi:elongation factor G